MASEKRTQDEGGKRKATLELSELVAGIGGHRLVELHRFRHAERQRLGRRPCCVWVGLSRSRRVAYTRAAWLLFFGTFVVFTAGRIGILTIDATWVFLGLAALFTGYGLLYGAAHPIGGLPLQTIAMAGFGTAAAVALIVNADAGAYLVAAGLLGHAAWDVYHHRVGRVVVRSMAEFCCVLDTLLAVAIVIAAVRS